MASPIHPLAADDPGFAQALAAALAGEQTLAPLSAYAVAPTELLRVDQPLDLPDAAVIVTTSGSTGAGKGVGLSAAAIEASVHATHARLGGPGDWILALPGHYVAGLMVIARSLVAGTGLFRVDSALDGLPWPQDRSYVSLVPTQLARALADPGLTERLAAYAGVLVGGAASDPALLARAREAGIAVVTTYGMSETCGGCVYDGVPLEGVRVDVEGEHGRIRLTTPTAFCGYRLRPELTAEVLSGQTVRTNDRGRWRSGRLEVTGRLDDVISSGGIKVDLAEVERAVRTLHPEAAVVGVPDHEWGTLVVAALTSDTGLTRLRERLAARLAGYARPRGLLRLAAMPMTSSGKIDRQALIERWPSHDDKEQV